MPFWTIDQILDDDVATQTFLDYARQQYFAENMEFLLAVREYRAHPTVAGAQAIYDRFIRTDGPHPYINIPGELREQLRRAIPDPHEPPPDEPPPADLFLKAVGIIKGLMLTRIDDFVKTPQGAPYREQPGLDGLGDALADAGAAAGDAVGAPAGAPDDAPHPAPAAAAGPEIDDDADHPDEEDHHVARFEEHPGD